MSAADSFIDHCWERAQRSALVVGVATALLSLPGLIWSPADFFRAYLVAYNFWLGLGLGCMVLLMVQYLTGGAWGILIRRILEAGSRTLPLLLLLFVPVVAGLDFIYPWAGEVGMDSESKRVYLSLAFFLARAISYFRFSLALPRFLHRSSVAPEPGTSPPSPPRLPLFSRPAL